MIRKLAFGKYRLYSRKKNPKTGRRRNLGTFATRAAAERHERAVQYFKRHWTNSLLRKSQIAGPDFDALAGSTGALELGERIEGKRGAGREAA
jgi:hypothetical protein